MSTNAHSPIGVFDSGIGGLTVVRALMERLPYENIVYFGDTARVPYGVKSVETIAHFTTQIAQFLLEKDVKLLVIACTVIGGGLLISKALGWSKIATLALLGGGGLLPFMVALLVLIVLGNDSMYQARHGKLPKRFVEENPDLASFQISA